MANQDWGIFWVHERQEALKQFEDDFFLSEQNFDITTVWIWWKCNTIQAGAILESCMHVNITRRHRAFGTG